ncbi:MAG: hypothetical protein U5K27_10235 [Desulfotignum sp.]|nr:hypothetical protein [Desulfotignum sp.]
MFTVNSQGLIRQKGWRLIQLAALFFIFWNLDTLAAHFLDNQIEVVRIQTLSITKMVVVTQSESQLMAVIYYFLKMDHIWCVPAMVFLFMGSEQPAQGRRDTGLTSTQIRGDNDGQSANFTDGCAGISGHGGAGNFVPVQGQIPVRDLDPDNVVFLYLIWICAGFTIFAVSRSLSHILRQFLVLTGSGTCGTRSGRLPGPSTPYPSCWWER